MNKKNVAIGILAGTTLYFWFSVAYILTKNRELEIKYANLETKYVALAREYANVACEYKSAKATIDKLLYDIVNDI